MGWGKFILGALGWTLGGPLGAIIGVAIGALFGDGKDDAKRITDGGGNKYRREDDAYVKVNDFRMALLVLTAAVLRANGHVKRSELDVVKAFLKQTFGEDGALEALKLLKGILDQRFDVHEVALQVGSNLNYSQRLALLDFLFDIAFADGEVTSDEERCISEIAGCFNVSQADFNALKARFMSHSSGSDWAYRALEIDESASNEEVKKAYRRMVMKFHPDKVATLGEDVKRQAEEKFKEIQRAYETIKAGRGL